MQTHDVPSTTPHTKDQLEMANSPRGGFRLLWPSDNPKPEEHATLAYVVEHSGGGSYSYTVITREQVARRISLDAFQTGIVPRSTRIDAPKEWRRRVWSAYKRGNTGAAQLEMQRVHQEAGEAEAHDE